MDTDTIDSGASDVFVGKEPCSACGSRDNLARYADGHGFCFGCAHREPADKAYSPPTDYTPQAELGFRPSQFQISAIPKRNLSEQTCRFWSYGVGDYHSKTGLKPAQFANYRDPVTKALVAQKLRFAGKEFAVLKEKGAQIPLFGAHLWPNDRRSLIITEGEIDAMSVSQAQNHKFPVVSLPNGAQSAAKSIKENYEWICEFDKIVLMFDDDEPGREAMETVAQLLPVGKAHIATLDGYKDANEALVDNKPGAIISAFWGAKVYQPDGIFTLTDIREEILSPVEMGRPWFLPALTDLTYGRRKGETYYFAAGCVSGDTEFLSPTGWKRIDQWDGEPVSQYHEDGRMAFVNPKKYVKLPCPEMHEVKLKYGLSMALSPEHRVVHFSENTGKLSVTPFAEVMATAKRQGGFRGLIETTFTVSEENSWDTNMLRLQIAVEADGSMHKNKCHIRVKRPRKVERLVEILEACGITWSTWVVGEYTTLSFTPPMRKGALYSLPFDTFGTDDLKTIALEAPMWDGDCKKTFRTTVKAMADLVQYAMSSIGLRSCIGTIPHEGRSTEYAVRGTTRSRVSIRRAEYVPIVEDFKYCFQVETGMLVLRKDNRIFVTGNTGIGKTDFFTQQIAFDIMELGVKTACIYLEQPPSETGKRIAGKLAHRLFHIPDGKWTQDELTEALDALEATGLLYLGGNFASASWEQIKSRIRYMAISLGVEHIYLDHLTALADPSNERESLEIITKEIALLAQELGLVFHIISHLATPDGKPHEEGGRVMLRHFKGSRSIGFWAHFAFGLERNPQDEDAMIAQRTALRCLKDRYTGRANGKIVMLGYDTAAGIISECGDFPADDSAGGFSDLNI